MMARKRLHISAGVAVLVGGLATTAAAQGVDADGPTGVLEEVVVTAQRRAENLQDVPVAVTALSGDALKAQQVNDIAGLQRVSPALNIANFPGDNLTATVTLRGLGVSENLPTIDPAVGIYLDGVYIARSSGGNLGLIDLERVEVLRGPQGTLFGRNTIGGAINIVTAKPAPARAAYVEASYGNYDAVRLRGMINVPVSDALAVRVVGSHSEHDGYAHSSITGADLNPENTDYVRAQAAYRFDEAWDVLVSGDYTHAHFHGGQWVVPRRIFGTSASLIATVSGGKDSAANYNTVGNPSSVPSSTNGRYGGDIWGVAATLTGHLAPATFKAILGYRELNRVISGLDLDGTPYVITEQNPVKDTQEQVSAEVQLFGKAMSERLDWIVGAYYFREHGANLAEARTLFPFTQTVGTTDGRADNDSASLFAQLTYAVTENLRLTAGGRVVHDTRAIDSRNRNLTFGGLLASCAVTGALPPTCQVSPPTAKFTYAPFTLGIDYKPVPDALLYLKFSRGFRAGGFNLRGTTSGALTPFDPEHVDAVEIGAKTELFDHRLRLNVSAYESRYQNLQLSAFLASASGGATATITNAGRAQINGVEAEATAVLGDLTLSAGVGYIDARFKRLLPTVTTATLQSNLPYVPRWTANLAADYRVPTGFGAVKLHADYSYKDKLDFAPVPPADPSVIQKAYSIVNASVTADIGARLSLSVYGANLTDEDYDQRRFNLSVIGAVIGFPGDPRTYGVRAAYRF